MIILKEAVDDNNTLIAIGSKRWDDIDDLLRDHCDFYRKYELVDMISWAKRNYPKRVSGFVKDDITGDTSVSLNDIAFATSFFADFPTYEATYDAIAYI